MGFLSIISFAHKLIEDRLEPGETAVDATAGNGVDTLFLARTVASSGRVYAFDVQESALKRTKERLLRELAEDEVESRVTLIRESHHKMKEMLPISLHGRIGAVMFNLGYLPGGDHSFITVPETTLPALESAVELLRPGGILTVVLYSGHPGGETEASAVEAWAAELPQDRAHVMSYRFINQKNHPPYVIAIEKR